MIFKKREKAPKEAGTHIVKAVHADPVYHVLEQPGLGVRTQPPVSTPVGRTLGYHLRPGRHDILPEDWKNFADFADRVMPPR